MDQHNVGRDVNALIGDDTGYFPKQEAANIDPYWQRNLVGVPWQRLLESVGVIPKDKRLTYDQHRLVTGLSGSGEVGNNNRFGLIGQLATMGAPQASFARGMVTAGAPHLLTGVEAAVRGNSTRALTGLSAAGLNSAVNRGLPHKAKMQPPYSLHDDLKRIGRRVSANANDMDYVVGRLANKMAPMPKLLSGVGASTLTQQQKDMVKKISAQEAYAAKYPWGSP